MRFFSYTCAQKPKPKKKQKEKAQNLMKIIEIKRVPFVQINTQKNGVYVKCICWPLNEFFAVFDFITFNFYV